MLRTIRILFLSVLLIVASTSIFTARAATPTIDVLTAKGIVNPIMADYIQRGIEQAEKRNAIALVIQLDTPGGLDTSMRDIVQNIVNARVPVVVYVSPSGARAASAGVFITVAAHVAAMAPNTAIGAAHPVNIGQGGVQDVPSDMAEKIVNDAAAYIRSITESRGRNMEWAEKAVRESVSATEQEALKLKVIDLVSDDLNSLISQLDGREVTLPGGATVTLNTRTTAVNRNPMTSTENFLFAISDPNIAYLLLSIATIGIMAELYSPGLIFPGVIGAISLLIAFFSLGTLPVNYAGIGLIVLAIGLLIAEVFTGIGLLPAGGIISLILGSAIMFKGGTLFQVSPWLIGTIVIIIAGFFILVLTQIIKSHRLQATTGWEELIGKPALVKVALNPEGMVLYRGERWKAGSEDGKVSPGEEVIINKVDNLTLHVTRKKQERN